MSIYVTTHIVFLLLLDEVISLMKHVKLFYGIVGTHIDSYVQCQCHVTSEIVSRLLGDAISLMII